MPELPEVETIVRDIAPALRGRRILAVEVLHARIVRYSQAELGAVLPGRRIQAVTRHGKFILIELDRGWLTIHLGMTGQILFDTAPNAHTRAILHLDGLEMLYNDIRMFGSLEWSETPVRASKLGADALASETLPVDLLRRRAPIKAVLLNQSIFSGLGNIYTDEVLFRCGIHPRRAANRLSRTRLATLIAEIRTVLAEAVAHRGSSVSDYVDTQGREGGFQSLHRVYGREGLPCPRCGTAIRRIVVAQRGTHYCPKCQR